MLSRCFLKTLIALVFLVRPDSSIAQLPACGTGNEGILYYLTAHGIFNYKPSQPVSPGNPVANSVPPLAASAGLAVSANLNSPSPAFTFYTTLGGLYYYFDGSGWASTGHSCGGVSAVNIGAGGGYIFSINPINNTIYRYDGSGHASAISVIPGAFAGVADMVVDCRGNFYLLNTFGNQALKKYDPAGNLLYSWPLIGIPQTIGGGGFSIIGNKVYYTNDINSRLYTGEINCTGVIFSAPETMQWIFSPVDFAECSTCNLDTKGYTKSITSCDRNLLANITASGTAPYSWNILKGAATVAGSGPAFAVTADTTTTIVLYSSSVCGIITDTINLLMPKPTVIMTKREDTIHGCGKFVDTLHAAVIYDSTGGVTLNYQWSPTPYILSGGNSLHPVINPATDTTFILTVSTTLSGCTWKDSVRATVSDKSVATDFKYTIAYGCNGDTVNFQNQTTGATSHSWSFGDGSSPDLSIHPKHYFPAHGTYNVRLVSSNQTCQDSITKTVVLPGSLSAAFFADRDTVCQGATAKFLNSSVYDSSKGPVQFAWSFGDGANAAVRNPSHVFATAGTFDVMLTATDFRPCSDTVKRRIVVDPLPVADFAFDSIVCAGTEVSFIPHYTQTGSTGISWDFGDGVGVTDHSPAFHRYSSPGNYAVAFAASYRSCPPAEVVKSIEVMLPPSVELGPDTSICAEERDLVIGMFSDDESLTWQWNTGQTTRRIPVRGAGSYILQANNNGCTTSDTVNISTYTCNCIVSIPNAFTPNNDGRNDQFRAVFPYDCTIKAFELSVYNRWGQLVFSTQNPTQGWDGKFGGVAVETSTYNYMLRYYIDDAPTGKLESGTVILMR